jgi:hypothetical protein
MQHVDVFATHADQRARLVLTVAELPLLQAVEFDGHGVGDRSPELFGPPQGKQAHALLSFRSSVAASAS